jgi:hypothetical protein
MERQTLDKLEAAFEAVEKDLSGRVAELAARVPLGCSLRMSRTNMNKSCASMICSAYSSSRLRSTGPHLLPHKHGRAEAGMDTASRARRL